MTSDSTPKDTTVQFHKSTEEPDDNIRSLHGSIPLSKAFFFGLQHIIAMFVGNLTPILLVASVAKYDGQPFSTQEATFLIQATMLAAGIATLMQVFPVWRIGARLPLVMGTSFGFMGGCLALAAIDYSLLIGAIIVSGIVEGLLGLCVPVWRKMITPLVAGVVILTIGLSLLSTCMSFFAGGKSPDAGSWVHLAIATVTLAACLFAKLYFTGFWQQINVLFGLIVGYACAALATVAGLSPLLDLSSTRLTFIKRGLFDLPHFFPFTPTFDLGSIAIFTVICLTSAVQTIGTVEGICNGVLDRQATEREIGGAVSCDGFANTIVGWLLGCLPVTAYEQNIGVLMISKAVNLHIITAGSLILLLAGLMPAFGTFLSTLPACVLGGCLVMVFGSIICIGLKMVYTAGLNERNCIIASVSLCVGLGASYAPQLGNYLSASLRSVLLASPVTLVFIVAIILTLVLPSQIGSGSPTISEANCSAFHKE